MTALANSEGADTGWRSVLREMLIGARAAASRFPVTSIFLLAAALQANLMVAEVHLFGGSGYDEREMNLLLGLVAGASASLAAALSGEARGHSTGARVAAALVAAAIAAILLALPKPLLSLQWTLMLGLFVLVPTAAFLWRGNGASFWMFSIRTAFAVLLGVLALLLFAGGISAILASLTYLFGFEIPDRLYGHVWLSTGLFAAPLFGLGQMPDRFDEEPDLAVKGFMDRGMRALGDFVAAPLLIVYAAILHLYALKIVVTGEVPQGQIGWLVLVYGFCLFGALLVVNPFFDRARAPTRLFLRFWPFFLPIPLVLLFYALFLRVSEFGITPERYLLGLFGVVTAIVLVLQIFPRLKGDIRAIAALPAIALLLGGFGPQGAIGVSLSSQAGRFLAIVKNPPVEGRRHGEALAALSFLAGQEALARVVPEGKDISPTADDAYSAVARAWGLDPRRSPIGPRGIVISDSSSPSAFAVRGFDIVVQNVVMAVGADKPVSVRLPDGGELGFTLEPDSVIVTLGEESVRFALAADKVEELAQRDNADRLAGIVLEADDRRMLLMPSYIYLDTEDAPRLQNLQGIILLRAEDWRRG